MNTVFPELNFPHRHILGIEGMTREEINFLLDLSESYVAQNRRADKKSKRLGSGLALPHNVSIVKFGDLLITAIVLNF